MAAAVKDLGANVIRLPIHPEAVDGMGFLHDPESYFEEHLDPLVDAARDMGVHLIIDLHYVADYPDLADEAFFFWRKVAPRYKREPHVLYELFNEPIAPNDWETFRAFAQPLVDAVRKMAPDNVIIVGGPGWSLNMSGAADQPITGKNVMYAVHVYPRHPTSAWRSDLDRLMQNHPVFVTEWGYEDGAESVLSGTRSGFGEPFVSFLETRQLSWTAWIYDDRWTSRMLTEAGTLTGGEGGMGELVLESLRRSWSVSQPPTASNWQSPASNSLK
jgi:endoglucanase